MGVAWSVVGVAWAEPARRSAPKVRDPALQSALSNPRPRERPLELRGVRDPAQMLGWGALRAPGPAPAPARQEAPRVPRPRRPLPRRAEPEHRPRLWEAGLRARRGSRFILEKTSLFCE